MIAVADAQPLTREEACQLPIEERKKFIEKILVKYPLWLKIFGRIEHCHRLQSYAAKPPCLRLVALSTAGKTTLLESYAERFPARLDETGKRQPVVFVKNPRTGSINDLAGAILQDLGDPRADRGTVGNKTFRIEKLFREFHVELLILDELQHFVDRDSSRVLLNASNWLKGLIKTTKVAAVLAGIEGDAETIIDTNVQLASLFPDPIRLTPFAWDINDPNGGEDFRKFLMLLESMLPLKGDSHLSDPDRAFRCYVASGGVVGSLMALIRGAAASALDDGSESITDGHLEQYYADWLAAERRGIPNPFLEGSTPSLPKTPDAPSKRVGNLITEGSMPSPPKKPRAPSKRVGNLNRRGRSRKEHTDQMKDVF
jgi:hypothetical protein